VSRGGGPKRPTHEQAVWVTEVSGPNCLFVCLSVCSAFESTMEALQQPMIRVAAVIAEGVPEQDTKKLIAFARRNNKIILGPATVGGVQVRGAAISDGRKD
jgi:succinyl-CoA synthetase alpha subunit